MDSSLEEVLTHKNFLLYAMKHYDNRQCTGLQEFKDDLHRVKHIKKLVTRYQKTGELRERLILNHIILLNNVFGHHATVRILFLKMKSYLSFVVPFLILLNTMPQTVWNITEWGPVHTDTIPLDQGVIDILRQV